MNPGPLKWGLGATGIWEHEFRNEGQQKGGNKEQNTRKERCQG